MKRIEKDFLGTLEIDEDALYGIHSLRANLNFPITKRGMDPLFIRNMALVKKASALTNKENKDLEEKKADAIISACQEIIEGKHLWFIGVFFNDFTADGSLCKCCNGRCTHDQNNH